MARGRASSGRRWVGGAPLAALAAPGGGAAAETKGPGAQKPRALPAEVTRAWKKAGATVGWMRTDYFAGLRFESRAEGEPGEIPAFHLYPRKEGVLKGLPSPGVP